ncbi:hypothetical protein OSB04_012508 [Centaurea solstitialis]|uniref:Uncharacterized protein n=1 Tax=Centaurea solstitialis TaxID=347529 RepID=A0AA38TBH4_9ASTR|nr:hypothetical protein OSB04_012508 [Centaurea solstitialis]
MAKGAIPSSSLAFGIRKPKPMKRTIIRNKKKKKKNDLVLNKVISYLLTDCYMYNPLISPQPTFDLPPPKQISTSQEDMALPIRRSNNQVVGFLETDCYLYSPLLVENHPPPPMSPVGLVSGHFHTRGVSSSTETQDGQMQHNVRDNTDLGTQLRARLKVLKETVAYHESVKHTVHQICRSTSVQGP